MRARCRASDHSILAPEMAISSAHFLISEWMKAAKASSELAMFSMPWYSTLARMSSDWLILFTRAFKRWTIAAGVPAGATSPYQARTSNPGEVSALAASWGETVTQQGALIDTTLT